MPHWTVEYVLHVMETKDWSGNQLAQAVGLAASTITRPLSKGEALTAKSIGKIHRVTGIDPQPFAPSGMQEPISLYQAGSLPPKPKSKAYDVLKDMDEPSPKSTAFELNEIKIALVGPTAQIVATVDAEGLKKLQRKLEAVAQMLQD